MRVQFEIKFWSILKSVVGERVPLLEQFCLYLYAECWKMMMKSDETLVWRTIIEDIVFLLITHKLEDKRNGRGWSTIECLLVKHLFKFLIGPMTRKKLLIDPVILLLNLALSNLLIVIFLSINTCHLYKDRYLLTLPWVKVK